MPRNLLTRAAAFGSAVATPTTTPESIVAVGLAGVGFAPTTVHVSKKAKAIEMRPWPEG
jgi:hypothetical protein